MTDIAARYFSRRTALGTTVGLALAGSVPLRHAFGQDDATTEADPNSTPQSSIESNTLGEMPTTGGNRPGPGGSQPPQITVAGTNPVTIVIEQSGVDADVEVLDIVDGAMENPTGPWVVAWYQETAQLGEIGNVVLAGHVDYWDVGPSVFYTVGNLAPGDPIVLTGENGTSYTYAVDSVETIGIEELTSGRTTELIGPVDGQVLTIFTCGGEFDYENGEYLSRTVVRATLQPTPPSTPPA